MTFAQGPILRRVCYKSTLETLKEIPQKRQLEIIFMAQILPNLNVLSRRLHTKVKLISFVLNYKDHILLNWKYSPYTMPITSRRLEDYIVITELLNEWKYRALKTGVTSVTEDVIVKFALFLKQKLKATEFIVSKQWIQKFNTISKTQQRRDDRDLSLEFSDIIPKLKWMFIKESYNKYFQLLQHTEIVAKFGIEKADTFTVNDCDSDVEEIVAPVVSIDITDDMPEDLVNDYKLIKPQIVGNVSDAEDSCEEDSDTVMVYQYVETNSDEEVVEKCTKAKNNANNFEPAIDSDTKIANPYEDIAVKEETGITECFVNVKAKHNTMPAKISSKNNISEKELDDSDTVIVYQYVEANSEDEIDEQYTEAIVTKEFDEVNVHSVTLTTDTGFTANAANGIHKTLGADIVLKGESNIREGFLVMDVSKSAVPVKRSLKRNTKQIFNHNQSRKKKRKIEYSDLYANTSENNIITDSDLMTVYKYVEADSGDEIDKAIVKEKCHHVDVMSDTLEINQESIKIEENNRIENPHEDVTIKKEEQYITDDFPIKDHTNSSVSAKDNTAESVLKNVHIKEKSKDKTKPNTPVELSSPITDYKSACLYLTKLENFAEKQKDIVALYYISQLCDVLDMS